jgi:hypothetical protein
MPYSTRQGGVLEGSCAQNAGGLRFDTAHDAVNFGTDSAKRANDWLAANNVNVAERYIKGDIHVVLKLRAVPNSEIFDLVFRRVPTAVTHFHPPGDPLPIQTHGLPPQGSSAEWDDYAMRVGIPYAVECDQRVISSGVWLEAAQDRVDFRRDIFKFPSGEFTVQVNGIIGEGESSFFGIDAAKTDGGCVDGMIKSIPQIRCGILADAPQFGGELGSQPDLVNVLSTLGIKIDNASVWPVMKKDTNLAIQIINVVPCVAN